MPGLGLSGLFVLLSALALPLTRRRGVPVGRLFGLAAVMAAAIILTWEVIVVAVTATATATGAAKAGTTHPIGNGVPIAIPGSSSVRVPIIVLSVSILVLVIATGAALLRMVGVRPTPSPPPLETALPPEALAGSHAPRLPSPRHARRGGSLASVTCHGTAGAGPHRSCPGRWGRRCPCPPGGPGTAPRPCPYAG